MYYHKYIKYKTKYAELKKELYEESAKPIKITDSPTYGGLKMDFKIEKGGQPYSVSLTARNNGSTQGTLEIQKISPIA
jgi:hypothetical protein